MDQPGLCQDGHRGGLPAPLPCPRRGRWGEREGKRRDCLDSPVRSGSRSGADLGAEPGAASAWWSHLVSRPHGRVVSHYAKGNQRGPRWASRQRRGGGKLTCRRSNNLSWYYGPSRAWRSNTGWEKKALSSSWLSHRIYGS